MSVLVGGVEKRIRTSLEGLRLWDDVENARIRYAKSPSASSYETYERACEKYRAHPSIKKSEFESTAQECQRMEKERKELVLAYEEFLNTPSMYMLNRLIAQKNQSPSLSVTSVYRFADDCERWQTEGRSINIALKGYEFSGRFKCESWNVDFFAEMRIGGKTCFTIERNGIGGSDRNSPNDLRRSGFSPHQISHDVKIPNVGLEIKVQFVNKSGLNQWSGFWPIDFIGILKRASRNRGTTNEKFYDLTDNENSSVTFTFSGLPYVEE